MVQEGNRAMSDLIDDFPGGECDPGARQCFSV